MKKTLVILLTTFVISSCNNASTETDASAFDSTTAPEPAFNDTLAQPGGVANSNVISTDTAAINVQNSVEKADSLNSQK